MLFTLCSAMFSSVVSALHTRANIEKHKRENKAEEEEENINFMRKEKCATLSISS